MSKKFKIGDEVRVIKDLGYRGCLQIGDTATVISISPFTSSLVRLKNDDVMWSDGLNAETCALELVEHKAQPIVIYQDGMKVIALDKNTGKKGVAKCCPEDTFDFGYGAELAFARLRGGESQEISLTIPEEYKVGDIVVYTGTYYEEVEGKLGVIVKVREDNGNVGVEWKDFEGHSLGRILEIDRSGHCSGWWVEQKDIKLLYRSSFVEKKLSEQVKDKGEEVYNAKILITKTCNASALTEHKIYEIKDGRFVADDGDVYPIGKPLVDKEDAESYFRMRKDGCHRTNHHFSTNRVEFIEVVE